MKKSKKKKAAKKKEKEEPTKLNMTFEQAIQMSFAPKTKGTK